MNTVNRHHGWLRWIGSGVVVLVLGVSLYGGPKDGPSRTGRDRVDLGDHVLVNPTAKSRAVSFYSDDADFVTIRGGVDGAGGGVASVGTPIVVYRSQPCGLVSSLFNENLGWIDQMLLGNIACERSVLLRSFNIRACTDVCNEAGRCNPDGTQSDCGSESRSGCFNTGESATSTSGLRFSVTLPCKASFSQSRSATRIPTATPAACWKSR